MPVDLGRNDLGKIGRFGTVEVEKYLSVLRFFHIMHLGSTYGVQFHPESILTPDGKTMLQNFMTIQ